MHHLEYHSLLKILVVIATAVVVVYLSAIGYLDFSGSQGNALTPNEAGDALVTSGSYEEAIELYQDQITALDGALVDANLGLADAYRGNNELADAEAIYRRVIRLDGEREAAYVGLARVLIDQGKYAEARAELKSGMAVFPNDVDLLKLDDEATEAQQS